MAIHFEKERYLKLSEDYEKWWDGILDRPLIKIMVRNAYEPDRPKPNVPLLSADTCHLLEYSAEQLIDRIDYELSQYEFLGDAFPLVDLWSYGPGIVAGFCGAELINDTGVVEFVCQRKTLSEIHVKYDPQNKWAIRIKELYREGMRKWKGQVVLGMPDLGGFQDIVANFTDSVELMYALYDEPEEVYRLQEEVYQAWMDAYEDLVNVLKEEEAYGFSCWCGLFSKEPSYILQDDFAYMISPAMFQEFAYPYIARACKKLSRTIYHLDGVGNLNHLDILLKEPNLDAIQWVAGAGQPSAQYWTEIYDRIIQAGKGIEVIGGVEDFLKLYERYRKQLYFQCVVDTKNEILPKWGEKYDCIHGHGPILKEWKEAEMLLQLVQ